MASPKEERTLLIVKPDGVQRGLIGTIIQRFEEKGFKLVAIKFILPSDDQVRENYAELSHEPFFPYIISYMSKGPIVPMVWEGFNVVQTCRFMLAAYDRADSAPGSIRGDFAIQIPNYMVNLPQEVRNSINHRWNVIHGADSVEAAKKEIDLWFKPHELISWTANNELWTY